MSKKYVFAAFFSLFFSVFLISPLFAQKSSGKLSAAESANLKQGADAYKNEDWTSAIFFLRKVVAEPGKANDETYFMLIKSEIYAGEYRQAQNDCEKFLNQFAYSPYSEYIEYQNGRLLHLLARNEDAVLALSDFCHNNGDSELFPLALFWIAESFYDEYNFDSARGLYERVVLDYPACEKAPQAQYKLDLIERRAREEKLLYLLKMIGEENLSTREEYERQLRVYALEDEKGVKKALIDAQARIAELEAIIEDGGYPAYGDGYDTGIADFKEEVAPEPSSAPVVQPEPVPSVAETEPPADEAPPKPSSSGVSTPANPKQTTVNVIQNVNDSSLRVKEGQNGGGTAAVKAADPAKKSNAEVEALRRKSRQLQYLLENQSEGGEK